VRAFAPGPETVDLTDAGPVRRRAAATGPDVIVDAAIWNDPAMLSGDRRRAWQEYGFLKAASEPVVTRRAQMEGEAPCRA
jgi:dTDP-4-dehydrorhamnose reductase